MATAVSPVQAQQTDPLVCNRTLEVRDAIVDSVVAVSRCADVTDAHLAGIGVLNLSGSSIATLQGGDFAGLTDLRYLYLDYNSLTALPEGVFAGLPLEALELNHNSLTELPMGVFADLPLEELHLEHNSLRELPMGVFAGLPLKGLYLNHNSLTALPEGVFAGLPLEELYLHNNSLRELPLGVFADLLLEALHLDYNSLTELPMGVFAGLPLEELYLDHNSLGELPLGVFAGLTDLLYLYLHNNNLMGLSADVFSGLTALVFLNLGDNSLTALPGGVFSGLPDLQALFLDGNGLTALPGGVFSGLTALQVLFLDGNPGIGGFRPIANAGADQTAGAGQVVTLTATASEDDPWGDNVSYAWTRTDDSVSVLTLMGAETASLSFVMPAGATGLEFKLTVTGRGGSFVDTARLKVRHPVAVVTLTGPGPVATTDIVGDSISLVYSYSADNLYGRALTGSIEVAAAVDGDAVTPTINIDGARGEITIVLEREAYPNPGGHLLAVSLSLGAAADGFVLGETSSITTPFSFLPLPPTRLEVRQAEGNQDKQGASDTIELGYSFDYAADNRLNRPRSGLAVQVDFELCPDATASGCSSLAAASRTLTLDGNGSLTLRIDRTLDVLSVFGEADDDAIRYGRVLLSTAGDESFVATVATTSFSFVIPADPSVCDRTPQVRDAIVEVTAAVSHCAYVTDVHLADIFILDLSGSSIATLQEDDFAGLTTLTYLNLSANSLTALPEGVFAGLTDLFHLSLNSNNLMTLSADVFSGLTALDFINLSSNSLTALPGGVFSGLTALSILLLDGNPGNEGFRPIANAGADQTAGAGQVVTLTATASDDDPWGDNVSYAWTRTDNSGSVLTLMGAETASLSFVMPAGATELEFELRVTGRGGPFVGTASLKVRHPVAVVTLTGPKPVAATDIVGDSINLVYTYSAADLHGRVLAGKIKVATAVDGDAVTPTINIDGARGDITIVLAREAYPHPGGHLLAVTLSLSAAADGFVLGETSSITTPFRFLPLPPTRLEVRQAEGNQDKQGASDTIELGYSFDYAADNRLNRPRSGLAVQVDFELCPDATASGCSSLAAASQILTLDGNGSLTLRIDRTLDVLSVFGEADDDAIRYGRVLLSTAGDESFVATVATTSFSFVIPADPSVCDRTPQVRDEIVGKVVAVSHCAYVTDVHLAGLVALNLSGRSIATLQEDDFAGFTALKDLFLDYNSLTALPEGVFSGLPLEGLSLYNNNLMELSADVFAGLPLKALLLNHNNLRELPMGVFSGLTDLQLLYLHNNSLTELPKGVFAGLPLEILHLDYNSLTLTALPGGVFSGLTALKNLLLEGNPGIEGFRPIANAGADQTAGAGQVVTLTATVSDEDPWGDNVSYAWTRTDNSGSVLTLMGAEAASLSFVMPAGATELEFELKVTGRGGDHFVGTTSLKVRHPVAVVTLTGPEPVATTDIVEDSINLVYTYSAADLHGRVLAGKIKVAAAIDGVAVTPAINIDGARGEITIVLEWKAYPNPDWHLLAVTLSLGAAADGFVLGDPSSITTPFSFLPFPPTRLEVRQAEGNQDKQGAAASDTIELGYSFDYAAGNRLNRPRSGLAVQVDFEFCPDATASGCSSLAAASRILTLDGNGSLTLRIDRTLAGFSAFGEADDDSIRHGRVLLSTAGDESFVATVATTRFSFVVPADPSVCDRTPQVRDEIVDKVVAVSHCAYVTDAHLAGIGGLDLSGISIATLQEGDFAGLTALKRLYLDHNSLTELPMGVFAGLTALTRLYLDHNSLEELPRGVFSGLTALKFLSLEGNPGSEGFRPIANAGADQTAGAGQVVTLTATASDEDPWGDNVSYAWRRTDNSGSSLTLMGAETASPSFVMPAGATELEFELKVTGRGGPFVGTASLKVRHPVAVVTLTGPGPVAATDIVGDSINLVYTYSAADLHGRVLAGKIKVAAAIDGDAVTPTINIDGARGEITIVLEREAYPHPGGHLLAVTLSLGAAADGFVLGGPSSITTPFSFLPLPPTRLEVRQAEGNQDKQGASDTIELGYSFDYAADNRLNRPRSGLAVQVDFEFCPDATASGCSSLAAASRILTLDGNGSLTLRIDRTLDVLSVFGEADDDSIRHGRVLLSTAGDESFVATVATTSFSFVIPADPSVCGRTPQVRDAIVDKVVAVSHCAYVTDVHLAGIVTLTLSGSSIATLQEGDFAGLTALKGLYLDDNSLMELPLGVFAGLPLEGLYLHSNNLMELSADVFSGVPNLQILKLGDNSLTSTVLPAGVFSELPALKTLSLEGNGLTALPEDVFAGLPDLHYLYLQNNSLTVLPAGVFSELPALKTLSLEGNGLTALPEGVFAGLTDLHYLYLQNNSLTLLPAGVFSELPDLQVLSLDGNPGIEGFRPIANAGADQTAGAGQVVTLTATASEDDPWGDNVSYAWRRTDDSGSVLTLMGAETASLSFVMPAGATGLEFELRVTGRGGPFVGTASLKVRHPVAVVTLTGPGPVATTDIVGDSINLVYTYSAADLHGRVLAGKIKVAAAVDGDAVTPSINIDGARGEITIVLERDAYLEPDGHLLAVTLSLGAAADGFVLGETSSITTPFSFRAVDVPDTVVTLSGPGPVATTDIVGDSISLVYSYSADNLYGRALTGSIEVAAAIDGDAVTPAIYVDETKSIGEIIIVLKRESYLGPGSHLLAVTLSLSAAAKGFVLGETSSITTLFSFSLLSTAIAEDGTCQLGMLEPGENCRYKGSSMTMSVPKAGSQVLFFELSGHGEPLSLKDASNPNDPNDPNVYNLHAVMLGRSYQIIRIYTAPEEFFSAELGSMGGAAILWAALFFFVDLARGLAGRRSRCPRGRRQEPGNRAGSAQAPAEAGGEASRGQSGQTGGRRQRCHRTGLQL